MKLSPTPTRPTVLLIGHTDHADFRDAANLLRVETTLVTANMSPELIVVAHSRPGTVDLERLDLLRRTWPLAGIVVLAGSWCEGELRTGRPLPGVHRLYWYEFPAWWRRQLALCAAGLCPDWARPGEQCFSAFAASIAPRRQPGLVIVNAYDTSTGDALADVLHRAGYASTRSANVSRSTRGATAAIWNGGQLSEAEERELSRFCAELSASATPVIGLLDFPRVDRVDRAMEIGVSAVLAKPWLNSQLLATIESISARTWLPAAA